MLTIVDSYPMNNCMLVQISDCAVLVLPDLGYQILHDLPQLGRGQIPNSWPFFRFTEEIPEEWKLIEYSKNTEGTNVTSRVLHYKMILYYITKSQLSLLLAF